jgi:hypothetical protein
MAGSEMAEFYVRPEALSAFARKLDRLQNQVPEGLNYVEGHCSLDFGDTGALLGTVLITTNAARDATNEMLEKLSQLLDASAAEIRASAQLYRRTDDDVDARMDSRLADLPD